MPTVVSVSLGSKSGDHCVVKEINGQEFVILRRGTDGDVEEAIRLLGELDGTVDAIGIGGTDIYLGSKGYRFPMKDGIRMFQAVTKTPVVDGSGLKHSHERRVIERLADHPEIKIEGARILMPSAMDRFGMAEGIVKAGGIPTFADLVFALGAPVNMVQHDLGELLRLATKLWPDLSRKATRLLYPTGAAQDLEPINKFPKLFAEAEVVAGDWYLIRKYLPPTLEGKTVITNTLRLAGREMLKDRGVSWLVTTTPDFGDGASFGTNVIEAVMVVLLGKPPEELTDDDYLEAIDRFKFEPRIERLN